MNPNLSLVDKDKGCLLINTQQVRIEDTQCKYTNTRTSNAKIYMNPTLGKEVGEINPPLKLSTMKKMREKTKP